jgi:hypothetical protein
LCQVFGRWPKEALSDSRKQPAPGSTARTYGPALRPGAPGCRPARLPGVFEPDPGPVRIPASQVTKQPGSPRSGGEPREDPSPGQVGNKADQGNRQAVRIMLACARSHLIRARAARRACETPRVHTGAGIPSYASNRTGIHWRQSGLSTGRSRIVEGRDDGTP